MKKIIALLTVIAIALSLTACGNLPIPEDVKGIIDSVGNQMENAKEISDKQNELADEIFSQVEENLESQKETEEEINDFVNDFFGEQKTDSEEKNDDGNTSSTFYNDSIDGRWIVDSISVAPKSARFENGNLIIECFIVNGYSTTATKVNISSLTVYGKGERLYAKGDFYEQNLTIAPLSYLLHTFEFSGDAVKAYGADLSFLSVDASFSANH